MSAPKRRQPNAAQRHAAAARRERTQQARAQRPQVTSGPLPLYDVDRGLAELGRQRLKRDGLTRGTVQLSDSLVEHLLRHLSPDETETAGRVLLIASSSVASLVVEARAMGNELDPAVVLNILGFAGGRMITEGRAWTGAQPGLEADR